MTPFKEIFEREYTWIAGFMRNVFRYPQKDAMISPSLGRKWSYNELNEDANRLANAFKNSGVTKGDVVMYLMLNSPEFVFTYVATNKLHAVSAPISYRLSPGEIAQSIDDNKPKVFLFDYAKRDDAMEGVRMAQFKPKYLICITEDCNPYTSPCSAAAVQPCNCMCCTYPSFIKGSSKENPVLDYDINIYDETVRLFTSGTTGRQKGVPLTSINEVLSSHDVMIHFPMSNRDVTMNTTPWFHRGGLHCAGPCPALYAGATMVIMDKFSSEATLDYVAKYKITFIVGVPTVLEDLADEQEKLGRDISSLKGIVTMGSPLERAACIRYQNVLTPNIYNGYGTTETFWNTFLRPCDLPENAGTAGSSCVDDDVRVVKVYEDRRAEPEDLAARDSEEIGEVIMKTPAKSPYCYSNNPEETEKKFYKDYIYTNDLGTWDKNGFVTIIGRKDDMIISSGENIYPTQIEEVLNTNPKVKDCMVTAVPDRIRGEIVTAYVVKNDESLTAHELDEFCKESAFIANFKRPRYYRFISQLPINATGKKLHYKLKEIARQDLKNGLLIIV